MSDYLKIIYNNITALEYDRRTRLPGKRRQFLDLMDMDMDEGISMGDQLIEFPSQEQKAKYVAMNLIDGLHKKDDTLVSITCAYLGDRVPKLKLINASESGDSISMELIYE